MKILGLRGGGLLFCFTGGHNPANMPVNCCRAYSGPLSNGDIHVRMKMKLQRRRRRALSQLITTVLLGLLSRPDVHALYANWGPFRIDTRVGVSAGVEYTDNVYLSETDRKSDVALSIGPVVSGSIGFDFPLVAAFPQGQKITLSLSAAYTTSLTKDGPQSGFGAPAAFAFDWPLEFQFAEWRLSPIVLDGTPTPSKQSLRRTSTESICI
jgi:hypothetical protein